MFLLILFLKKTHFLGYIFSLVTLIADTWFNKFKLFNLYFNNEYLIIPVIVLVQN